MWRFSPASPLVGQATVLQANVFLEAGQPAKAVALVEQHRADLAEPQAELLLARAYEADGNVAMAAAHYQKIYVDYPLAKEATPPKTRWRAMPLPILERLLARGLKLLEGGDRARAAKELAAVVPQTERRRLGPGARSHRRCTIPGA